MVWNLKQSDKYIRVTIERRKGDKVLGTPTTLDLYDADARQVKKSIIEMVQKTNEKTAPQNSNI